MDSRKAEGRIFRRPARRSDRKPYEQLESIMVQFDPLFPIMPGTAPASRAKAPELKPFQQVEPANTAGE